MKYFFSKNQVICKYIHPWVILTQLYTMYIALNSDNTHLKYARNTVNNYWLANELHVWLYKSTQVTPIIFLYPPGTNEVIVWSLVCLQWRKLSWFAWVLTARGLPLIRYTQLITGHLYFNISLPENVSVSVSNTKMKASNEIFNVDNLSWYL